MESHLFDWILAATSGILGFLLKTMWEAVKDLQNADKELAEKVGHIETLVAGQYVKRDEFNSCISRLFEKLDRIDEKLDNKVGRVECKDKCQ